MLEVFRWQRIPDNIGDLGGQRLDERQRINGENHQLISVRFEAL